MSVAICIIAGLISIIVILGITFRAMKSERDELKSREAFLEKTVAAHTEYAADKEEINEWKETQYAFTDADATSVIADIIAGNNSRLSKPEGEASDNTSSKTAKAGD